MGYRTSIKNMNAVGHLVEGNIYTFFQQIVSSDEMKDTTIKLLDRLINRIPEEFYTSQRYRRGLRRNLDRIRSEWNYIKKELARYETGYENMMSESNERDANNGRILNFLREISQIFSRCKVKAVLLPGFDSYNSTSELMLDENFLRQIVEIHPEDTALILQFTERLEKDNLAILEVFNKFETALNRVDDWPGVLLWNDTDSIFLPTRHRRDVIEIFEVIKYEANSFHYLRNRFQRRYQSRRFAYLFHLSDLHFGNKLAEKRLMRVVRILEKQLQGIEESASVFPIITGDLMNSPNSASKQIYLQFCELLLTKGFESPIHVLGNHDVDTSGFVKLLTTQKFIISSLVTSSRVELIDELGLGIIKFDSNTGGEFAQGQIGEDQLMQIGNELDSIKNIDDYTLIAILHHHPKEIENPNWYAKEWYESLLGNKKFERTMKLIDSDLFLEWISARGIKYVLHGHKHIPKVHSHKDITIIAAGSTTGSVRHKEAGKTFLTYNLIKYDIEEKRPVVCSIIAEEILGAGTKNLMLHLM